MKMVDKEQQKQYKTKEKKNKNTKDDANNSEVYFLMLVMMVLKIVINEVVVTNCKQLFVKTDSLGWLVGATILNRIGARVICLFFIWGTAYIWILGGFPRKLAFLNKCKKWHIVFVAILLSIGITMFSVPIGYKAYSTPEHKKMLAGTFCIEAIEDMITGETIQVDLEYEDIHFMDCRVRKIIGQHDSYKTIDYISFETEEGEYVIPNVMDNYLKSTYFLDYRPEWRITIYKNTGLIQSIEPLGEPDGTGRVHVIF